MAIDEICDDCWLHSAGKVVMVDQMDYSFETVKRTNKHENRKPKT